MSSRLRRIVVVMTALSAATLACSSSATFDRAGAVNNVIQQSGGRLTRHQAECYVDRVVGELGSGALTPATQPPELIPKLTRLRIDCTGLAALGTDPPPVPTTPSLGVGSQPTKFGDDAALDALYSACRDRSGSACDRLFDQAGLGTDYEEFASTCGGRTKEMSCAARYPDAPPGSTPKGAAAPATVPPR